MLTRDYLCDAALPQSVDAEAKNIAQEVVPRRDATKYVIVLPCDVGGNVRFDCGQSNLNFRAVTSASRAVHCGRQCTLR
jgi:hypothetical protein